MAVILSAQSVTSVPVCEAPVVILTWNLSSCEPPSSEKSRLYAVPAALRQFWSPPVILLVMTAGTVSFLT